MSKYSDLAERIKAETSVSGVSTDYTLRWLDEHLDQAPGRTITESELIAAVDETNHEDMNEYQKARALLVHLGYTVLAPEPTNVEKLEAIIADVGVKEIGFEVIPRAFAGFLHRRGVTAPEVDHG